MVGKYLLAVLRRGFDMGPRYRYFGWTLDKLVGWYLVSVESGKVTRCGGAVSVVATVATPTATAELALTIAAVVEA